MNIKTPKKNRNLIILVFLILAVIVYGVLAYVENKRENEPDFAEENFLKLTYVSEQANLLLDSDNDGVYDWEEDLWDELDPNNPDSDGDGIFDDEYIEQKKRQYTQDLYEQAGIDPLSETERFGRSMYTALYAAIQNGDDLDEADREQISDNIQNYIETIPLSGKQYFRDDFNLVSNDKVYVDVYEQRIRAFFNRYEVTFEDAELILSSVENPSLFSNKVGERSRYYEEMLGVLVEFEVPFVIANKHADLVNSIAQMYGAFSNLASQEFDEVLAISAVAQLEQITQDLLRAQVYIYRFFDIMSDSSIYES